MRRPQGTAYGVPLRELPSRLPYCADEPIPEGYHVVEHPNWALTSTGIGVLGAAWITS
ncbi:MAG: hypothetical protein RIF41_20605 [Polyangiaceae bacterium]